MFGMGTGGSLRLLSPETKLSLDAFAAAFLVSSVRPSIGLPTSFLRRRSGSPHSGPWRSRASHPQNRTGSIRSRPTKAFAPLSKLLTNQFFRASGRPLGRIPGSPSSFALRSAFRFTRSPVPFCLSPVPFFSDQALDRLVSSSSIRYRTSTDDLSTLSSSRGLTS